MSKKELIQIRDATYREPEVPAKRCETCLHVYEFLRKCKISKRMKDIDLMGVCDAWEARP